MSNSFATPWTVAHQALLSMEFSRQENLSGLSFPSPGDLPNPGIESSSPELQADSLPSEPPGKSAGSPRLCILTQKFSTFPLGLMFFRMCVCIGENLDREEIAHLCASPPLPYPHQSLMGRWEPGALMPDTAGNWGIRSQVTGRSCSPKPVGCQELKRRKVLIKDD